MLLIVGLGNPGKEYEHTPHNAGFMVLAEFAQKNSFPEFVLNKKANALVSEGIVEGQKVLLVKPQTFMNSSGSAVKFLYTRYKIPFEKTQGRQTTNLVVIHDDIDIPLGKVKISQNRGSAGHKGVESIIQALGTKNFTRIRIGIQPFDFAQGKPAGKPESVEAFVIKKLPKDKRETLQLGIQNALTALNSIARNA